MPTPDEEMRTIYVLRGKGAKTTTKTWYKLTFPASCKVTFGPLTPGNNGGYRDTETGGLYLRVYKTKDHQLAVIPNVLEFRDAEVEFAAPTSNGFEPEYEIDLLGKMVEEELKKP